MIMEMFRDLELYDECEDVIEMFPEMNEDGNGIKPTPKKVHMGTKLLKKGHKVKSIPPQAKATVLPQTL